jgi:rubredoxin
MNKWICVICGFIYDPASGIAGVVEPGVRFEDLPEDWICPECGSPKASFEPYEG